MFEMTTLIDEIGLREATIKLKRLWTWDLLGRIPLTNEPTICLTEI